MASECSSTISSSDDDDEDLKDGQTPTRKCKTEPSISPTLTISPEPEEWAGKATNAESTNESAANPKKTVGSSNKSRLSNLIASMKIPKFGRSSARESRAAAAAAAKEGSAGSKSIVPPSPTRSLGGDWSTTGKSNKPVGRSRSIGNDDESGGLANSSSPFSRSVTERHSYRAPSATSRYMQAAEAYAARSRAGRKTPTGGQSNSGTWSSRSRERAELTADTYRAARAPTRTASASPGPLRRQRRSSGGSSSWENDRNTLKPLPPPNVPVLPTSTHSTPSRKPNAKKSARELATELDADDDLILKRMEEILLTYKSKVEDHLAAEGRELPKEIFEDFTTQWVNEAASSLNSSRAAAVSPIPTPSTSSRSVTPSVRTTPTWRKEHRDGQKETKIPVPTFFNSPIPSETHI